MPGEGEFTRLRDECMVGKLKEGTETAASKQYVSGNTVETHTVQALRIRTPDQGMHRRGDGVVSQEDWLPRVELPGDWMSAEYVIVETRGDAKIVVKPRRSPLELLCEMLIAKWARKEQDTQVKLKFLKVRMESDEGLVQFYDRFLKLYRRSGMDLEDQRVGKMFMDALPRVYKQALELDSRWARVGRRSLEDDSVQEGFF